ncbi:MAG TPA: MauE/DoxX family redox-associated membrane protein [Verrucomicrobiae bacterium]|nr:MauE/DoxX family redox-associated membrane protein [Verrucomicrobiae bacterium]
MQKSKVISGFFYSAGFLLLITSAAKLISATGHARILENPDPIFAIPFRWVFWIVGGIEAIIATVCFFSRQDRLRAVLLACLTSNFVFYRAGLYLLHYQRPCSCLGNLTDAVHVSPKIADAAMKIILAYLLFGSYAALLWLRRQKHKVSHGSASPGGCSAAIL